MKSMLNILENFLRKTGLHSAPLRPQETLRRHDDLLIPCYPPIDFGIPACSPMALLDRNQDIVEALQQSVSDRVLFDAHYHPTMLRLADMLQLLPASFSHHHRNEGGLLRHSLEVGLMAVQLAKGEISLDFVVPPQEGGLDPRWMFAVFIAGVAHDLGKVVTDITVTDQSQALKWSPYASGLYEWSKQNGVENYFIHWRDGREKKHISVSGTLFNTLMGKDTLKWVLGNGGDKMTWIHESLNGFPGESNNIHRFVVAADQYSVKQDLKSIGRKMLGDGRYSPVPQHTGSTPDCSSKIPTVPQSNSRTKLGNMRGAAENHDVPQHSYSAPDELSPNHSFGREQG